MNHCNKNLEDSIKKAYSFRNRNQKVKFSELVFIEEVQRNVSLEEVEEEAIVCNDLDSFDEEEETINETSD